MIHLWNYNICRQNYSATFGIVWIRSLRLKWRLYKLHGVFNFLALATCSYGISRIGFAQMGVFDTKSADEHIAVIHTVTLLYDMNVVIVWKVVMDNENMIRKFYCC